MSEDTVIRHGAPTLAGMKTGNLFPCFFSSPQALAEELRAMNRVLVPRGLRLGPLRREKGRALLYLFRPAALSRDLAQEEVRRLLRQAGYRDLGQGACLAELRRRLGAGGDFPHEIGLVPVDLPAAHALRMGAFGTPDRRMLPDRRKPLPRYGNHPVAYQGH